MIESNAYPKYQDAKIPWLDAVPEHWDVMPLFSVATEIRVKNIGMIETNLLSLSYGQIVRRDINSNEGLLPESFETYQIVEAGDIVFRMTDLQNDQRSLRSALARERGIITSAYIAVRPDQMNSKFLNYQMRAYDVQKVFYAMGGGLRQSLKFEDMRRLPLVIPSTSEQQFIVDYLDRETVRIDTLIAKKTRFIELLKEKRQAVITKAVTKGLDDSAEMKDSGLKWLGYVPTHWSVMACKYGCSLIKDGTHLPPARVGDGVPLLSVRNVQDGKFSFRPDDSMISEADYTELCRSFQPMANDVLLAIVGATIGKTAVIPESMGRFHIQRSLAVFRFNENHNYLFMHFVFQSSGFQQLLWEGIGFSAQPGVYLGALANFRIPVPPTYEQRKIVEYLARKCERTDALIQKAQRSIELLKEKRSALITAAVTGKIDVREAA
ncbi:restriction endonuclease subunit S [Alcaligenaceae bacterium]|nr:restriction endonuclease subunit S [Alcaligenaceae bacterium]